MHSTLYFASNEAILKLERLSTHCIVLALRYLGQFGKNGSEVLRHKRCIIATQNLQLKILFLMMFYLKHKYHLSIELYRPKGIWGIIQRN